MREIVPGLRRLAILANVGNPFAVLEMAELRRRLAGADDGNRQMVDILTAVLADGLPAVVAA